MDRCVRKISFGEGNTTQTFKTADSPNSESVTLSRLTVGIIAQHSSRTTVLAGFSSADGSIRLYDVETGALLACVQGQTAVSDLALVQISEPGGTMNTRLVSTGGSDGTIMLWNLTMPSQDGTKQLGGNGFSSPDPSKPKPGSSMRLVRRVLSKAEIASFQRSLKEKGDNKPSLPRNLSPSRLRRKPSRYAVSDPSDVPEPQVASKTHSSELTGRGTVRGNRLKHASPPLSPKVNLHSRTRRSSLDERHRHTVTKSADNIDATAKQISNTLHDFRKVLASSQESLSINSAQALKRQLQATMDAILPIDQRSDRIRDEVRSESFDEYLASMIDQRMQHSPPNLEPTDCKNTSPSIKLMEDASNIKSYVQKLSRRKNPDAIDCNPVSEAQDAGLQRHHFSDTLELDPGLTYEYPAFFLTDNVEANGMGPDQSRNHECPVLS
ncbi:MAG: hypothetical protein Q9226_002616 [Calogaya cf. arnoldii]